MEEDVRCLKCVRIMDHSSLLTPHSSLLSAYVVGFKEAPLTATQVLYVNLVTAVTMGM